MMARPEPSDEERRADLDRRETLLARWWVVLLCALTVLAGVLFLMRGLLTEYWTWVVSWLLGLGEG